MHEVVEFRPCLGSCGNEDCKEHKEVVLFEHKDKPQCVQFMKLRAHKKGTRSMTVKSETEVSYTFYMGRLVGIIHMRVQKQRICADIL